VKPQTLKSLDSAERAVGRLIQECRKDGPLYRDNPKAVAQVSRTSKWLLNAIVALREIVAPKHAKEIKS